MKQVDIATICDVKDGKKLVKVDLYGRVSDWIPYAGVANKFVKVWSPPAIGEQVIVLFPYGDLNGGVVITSIFNEDCKEPIDANSQNFIISFANGTELKVENGDFIFKGNIKANGTISSSGDISTAGKINDNKGDLTNFTTTNGGKRA